ncbi:efflux RND transporter periplasmic adaptor subunit [Hoeflea sp. CAU 1731]
MAFRIKGSHITALIIAGAVIGWMSSGEIIVGGHADSPHAVAPPAERQENQDDLFKVRFVTLEPEQRFETLLLHGRTSAKSVISVRAETNGTLHERFVEKGDVVEAGDPVCRLDPGVRDTDILQAEAALEQAKFDYDGALKLKEKDYISDTRVKALKYAMDNAAARLASAKHEMSHVEIEATASGIVTDPIAEIGSHLSNGDVCVTLIDPDPMLFVGQVSERHVGDIGIGYDAEVSMITGEKVDGKISYVAPAADSATRTFLTEIELPNSDGKLRDGVTATTTIKLEGSEAYKIAASWLTLDDNGVLGVRTVDSDNVVAFNPVKIVAHTPETMWVTGLAPGARVITLGQDYVIAGQTVEPVPAEIARQVPAKADARS